MTFLPIQPIPATRPVMVAASRIDFTSLLSDMLCVVYIGFKLLFLTGVVVVVVFWFDPFARHRDQVPNYLCSQAVQPPKCLQGRFVYRKHHRSKPSGRKTQKHVCDDSVIHCVWVYIGFLKSLHLP